MKICHCKFNVSSYYARDNRNGVQQAHLPSCLYIVHFSGVASRIFVKYTMKKPLTWIQKLLRKIWNILTKNFILMFFEIQFCRQVFTVNYIFLFVYYYTIKKSDAWKFFIFDPKGILRHLIIYNENLGLHQNFELILCYCSDSTSFIVNKLQKLILCQTGSLLKDTIQ